MKEALFYEKLPLEVVQCHLCPHHCKIQPGKAGICGVRRNDKGKLVSLIYDKIIAIHVDPIEKKPLFHVHPGSRSFSIATVGCNFKCDFCQNYHISQIKGDRIAQFPGESLEPIEIVALAQKNHCTTIAYTYTEPTIYYELAYDCARLAHAQGLLNVFVTNGYICTEPLERIAPYMDAANVDLKGFDEKFYKNVVGGKLSAVLDTLRLMKQKNIFLEVTTLIVPTVNDDEAQLREVAQFIKDELGVETPWHISRFFPQFRMQNFPPTPERTILRARDIGLEMGLRYVYVGNLRGDGGENTNCYQCGELLIERYGFHVAVNRIREGKCPVCKAAIDGIGL